jgi:hypothetical protein
MELGEFRQSYAPVREVFETVHVEPLMIAFEESGLVSPADRIHALGKFGDDRQVRQQAYTKMLGTLPKGTTVNTAPLTGIALEVALDTLVSQYLPVAYPRLKAVGVLQSKTVREVAIPIAQERHRYTTSLPALEQATKDHQAQQEATREREALARVNPAIQAMSRAERDAEVGRLYQELVDADMQSPRTETFKI